MVSRIFKNSKFIAVDFDGTVVTHSYPRIGEDIGAVPILKKLQANGHKLLLNTMRCGNELNQAVDWFYENGINLYGVNNNPTQNEWTTSPKVHADLYIDDLALGVPLITNLSISNRPFVNWVEVEKMLVLNGLI